MCVFYTVIISSIIYIQLKRINQKMRGVSTKYCKLGKSKKRKKNSNKTD